MEEFFAIVKVSFKTAEKSHKHSASPLKFNDVVVLWTYMGPFTSCFQGEEVLLEKDTLWVITFLFIRKDKIQILQVIHFAASKLMWVVHHYSHPSGT